MWNFPSGQLTMFGRATPLINRSLRMNGFWHHRKVVRSHALCPTWRCVTSISNPSLCLKRIPVKALILFSHLSPRSRWQSSTPATASHANGASARHPPWQPPQKGFLSLLPSPWVPYAELMRLEKTGGLYGFYFPYLIGIGYAASIAPSVPSPSFVLTTSALFLAWNVLLRGSVCTINDILDREYDRQVARCRTRPIARGAVTPTQGYIWFAVQSVAAAGVVTQLPCATECFYHAIPIHFLLSVYPLAKRVTDFPQVVLSIPLAWAVFMSCSAFGLDPFTIQIASASTATACLFASQAIWIIMLDYVNACQDTVDDIKAGVRSMAVRYQNTFGFISTLSSMQVSLMVGAGYLAGLSPVYFIIACGGNAAMLATMAMTVKRTRPDICAWWFLRGSILVGGTTVVGLFGEYFMRSREDESPLSRSVDDEN